MQAWALLKLGAWCGGRLLHCGGFDFRVGAVCPVEQVRLTRAILGFAPCPARLTVGLDSQMAG